MAGLENRLRAGTWHSRPRMGVKVLSFHVGGGIQELLQTLPVNRLSFTWVTWLGWVPTELSFLQAFCRIEPLVYILVFKLCESQFSVRMWPLDLGVSRSHSYNSSNTVLGEDSGPGERPAFFCCLGENAPSIKPVWASSSSQKWNSGTGLTLQ